MNSIEDLRDWAGVPDGSQDALLLSIEAGVVAFLESATNRLYRCPPERSTQILNGPEVHTGGLSQDDPGPQQWVTLREAPYTKLDGTFTIAAGGTAVVGVGSLATAQLSAAPPSAISFAGGDSLLIDEIQDDLNFTLAEPHEDGVVAAIATAELIGAETRLEGCKTWTAIDPRELEVEMRHVYSPRYNFCVGRRTVRLTSRIGFEEGEGPADASLLVLQMTKAVYVDKLIRSETVGVPGAFKVTWRSLGSQAESFQERIELLKRPLSF